MKSSIYIILFLLFISASCQKTTATKETSLPSILSYLNAMTKRTDASFGIGGNASMRKGKAPFLALTFDGVFTGKDGLPKNIGDVTFGDKIWSGDPHNHYGNGELVDRAILGKVAKFKFKPHSLQARGQEGGEEGEIYVPREVIITSPTYADDIESNTIAPGSVFTWEIDPDNTKGMVIMVEYRPEAIGNKDFVERGYTDLIRRAVVVDDNGEYALNETLFEDIPDGASVDLFIIRANYLIDETEEGGYSYTVWAYNYKAGVYFYKP